VEGDKGRFDNHDSLGMFRPCGAPGTCDSDVADRACAHLVGWRELFRWVVSCGDCRQRKSRSYLVVPEAAPVATGRASGALEGMFMLIRVFWASRGPLSATFIGTAWPDLWAAAVARLCALYWVHMPGKGNQRLFIKRNDHANNVGGISPKCSLFQMIKGGRAFCRCDQLSLNLRRIPSI